MSRPDVYHTEAFTQPLYSGEVLRVESVGVNYPDGRPLLRDVSFSVQPGDFTWVEGGNGCGKTTLCQAITGIEPPAEGTIRLFGRDLQHTPKSQIDAIFHHDLGIGFQHGSLRGGLTVLENMLYYPDITGTSDRNTPRLAEHILGIIGLADKADKNAGSLSGGELQKAVLGSLLLRRPGLIVLDEPTASMDTDTKKATLAFLRSRADTDGASILVISHDQETAAFAKQRLVVRHGTAYPEHRQLVSQHA